MYPLASSATDPWASLWADEERDRFYEGLDSLGALDCDENRKGSPNDDWNWLTSAVQSRSHAEVVAFAQSEYAHLRADPELAHVDALEGSATGSEDTEAASCLACDCPNNDTSRTSSFVGIPVDGMPSHGISSKLQREVVDTASEGSKGKKRERGQAWSEDEHKKFLVGLQRFGKGDWRSISRICVITRTPAQVASHAQKYFLRQEGLAAGK